MATNNPVSIKRHNVMALCHMVGEQVTIWRRKLQFLPEELNEAIKQLSKFGWTILKVDGNIVHVEITLGNKAPESNELYPAY